MAVRLVLDETLAERLDLMRRLWGNIDDLNATLALLIVQLPPNVLIDQVQIEFLVLLPETFRALKRKDINTVGDLVNNWATSRLMSAELKGLGVKGVRDIAQALRRIGVALNDDLGMLED